MTAEQNGLYFMTVYPFYCAHCPLNPPVPVLIPLLVSPFHSSKPNPKVIWKAGTSGMAVTQQDKAQHINKEVKAWWTWIKF